MKKIRTFTLLLLAGLLTFSACTSSPASPAQSSTASTALTAPAPQSHVQNTSAAPEQISEAEAKEISTGLYNNGYIPLMRIYWTALIEPENFIEQEGRRFYRLKGYETKEELRQALGSACTQAFTERSLQRFFDGSQYLQMLEKDGILYATEGGGLGGTYELYLENMQIKGLSPSGWAFTLYAYDIQKDTANENITWLFNVVNENESWLIDSIEVVYSDGTEGHTY